jgi:LacI family transcriptional regulator
MGSASNTLAKNHIVKKRPVRVSARDVAKLAGVSQSTVSRVLNKARADLISAETRQRVNEAARQLGYSPDPIARALRGKRSGLLGLIVRDINDLFFAHMTAELSTQARLQNYQIVLGHVGSDPQEALEFTDILDARHIDGIFLLGDLQGDETALQEMLRFKHALVTMCRGPSPATPYTVNSDNFAGTNAMLDHLTELGHQKIGFIDGGWLGGDMRERGEAYRNYRKVATWR